MRFIEDRLPKTRGLVVVALFLSVTALRAEISASSYEAARHDAEWDTIGVNPDDVYWDDRFDHPVLWKGTFFPYIPVALAVAELFRAGTKRFI